MRYHFAFCILLYVTALSVAFSCGSPVAAVLGGVNNVTPSSSCDAGTESDIINEFLTVSQVQDSTALEKFHVHGWRWHTLSLRREAKRLHQLAERRQLEKGNHDKSSSLKEAADYVIGFNLKGLHNIEADLFFPWMREKVTSDSNGKHVSTAFAAVMDQLEEERQMVAQLGQSILDDAGVASDTSKSKDIRFGAIDNIVENSASLLRHVNNMMDRENRLLVPAIAALVPESEQKAFSDKVLFRLGVLDSRLHLVHMKEAVSESGDKLEQQLFEREIPYIPKKMIPRWKRKLYEPRADVLDL